MHVFEAFIDVVTAVGFESMSRVVVNFIHPTLAGEEASYSKTPLYPHICRHYKP